MKPERPAGTAPDPPRARSVVLGTAGHIDHGKTALVLALTGTDTDRLPEEKSRGITIDLGFASLQLGNTPATQVELSLVDVPGHHAFIRNMLAGTGGIDCVMLIVAADEGVKAQTIEHLAICSLLGIQHGLVVLTKTDLVNAERLQAAREQVARLVQGSFLEHAPVLAVSAATRAGIGDLKTALLQLALQLPPRGRDTLVRLPVDRSFSVRGFGTVATGTLHSGTLHVGDTVDLQPAGRTARIRGLQVHGRPVAQVEAPARTAVNLAGVDVSEVSRGDTVALPRTLAGATTIDVELTLLPGAPPLRHRAQMRIHAFTSETLARVLLYDTSQEPTNSRCIARLRLRKPLPLLPGDRFVLRQPSPACTVAGGRVLDAHPLPRLRKAAALSFLRSLAAAPAAQQLSQRVQRRATDGITLASLASETGYTLDALRRIAAPLLATGQLLMAKGDSASTERLLWPAAVTMSEERLLAELRRSRDPGLSQAELRSRTRLNDAVFPLVLGRLLHERRIVAEAGGLALPRAKAAISSPHAERLAQLEALYRSAGLAAPIVSEAATTLGVQAKDLPPLLTLLLRSGKLVRLGSDSLLVHADALAKLKEDLQRRRGEVFDVPRFKAFTGLTRKHAIPLLEYLDGIRVTRNSNGIRTVL